MTCILGCQGLEEGVDLGEGVSVCGNSLGKVWGLGGGLGVFVVGCMRERFWGSFVIEVSVVIFIVGGCG